ncbi:MAG: hypothetical protein PHC94_14970 [Methylobacter sp.]|nr:hypothetical protein [Methylobacter sp.]
MLNPVELMPKAERTKNACNSYFVDQHLEITTLERIDDLKIESMQAINQDLAGFGT